MAITVKYLEELGVDKEIAQQIFSERGKEIAEANNEKSALEKQVSEYKSNYDNLNAEFENLKQANASGEDWKTKYEEFKAETEQREAQAAAERQAKEKSDNDIMLFEKAVSEYGKKQDDWCNDFTKNGYFAKFVEAINAEENIGKSHKEVFRNLVKDDSTAFKEVQQVKLHGGKPRPTSDNRTAEDKARAVMGLPVDNK